MNRVFEIDQVMINRSETLQQSDINKWVFIHKGAWRGFTNTREEALELLKKSLRED